MNPKPILLLSVFAMLFNACTTTKLVKENGSYFLKNDDYYSHQGEYNMKLWTKDSTFYISSYTVKDGNVEAVVSPTPIKGKKKDVVFISNKPTSKVVTNKVDSVQTIQFSARKISEVQIKYNTETEHLSNVGWALIILVLGSALFLVLLSLSGPGGF